MRETVSPARAIEGVITLPGDKSISHRYGMLASIAAGRSTIANYSTGADCQSTLGAMQALGAVVERTNGNLIIKGGALREPALAPWMKTRTVRSLRPIRTTGPR